MGVLEQLAAIATIISALLFVLIEWPRIAPRLRALLVNVFTVVLIVMGIIGAGATVHGILTLDIEVTLTGLLYAAFVASWIFALDKAWKNVGICLAVLAASYGLLQAVTK